jgi:hypothetical protein
MARNLFEIASELIRDRIKAQIPSALASIRTDRADSMVTTEPPVNYFFSEQPAGFRAPSVFIITEGGDFNLTTKAANHINALIRMNVSVVVEDRDTFRLTYKSWRYQAALHQVLAQESLTSVDGAVTLKVKIASASFSPVYTNAQADDDPQGTFRKEVVLGLEIEHYEQL